MYFQYMCILLYVKNIWCNSIPYNYLHFEGGKAYIYHPQSENRCMEYCDTKLLYVKNIWCKGIPYTYGQLELWVVHVSSVYVHSAICETYMV